MAKVKKVPYYAMARSLFRGKIWKEFSGSAGAVPINTPQQISYERRAPGTPPPPKLPKPPKPTKEQLKAKKAEEAAQKALAQRQKKQPAPKPKQAEPVKPAKPQILDAEEREKLPEFDLQDIPGAMRKIGWPIAAKLAEKWFAGAAHVYNEKKNSLQPLDDTTVTLNWVLKYKNIKNEFDDLINKQLYTSNSTKEISDHIYKKIKNEFIDEKSMIFSFNTAKFIGDVRQFHIDWHFQRQEITSYNAIDWLLLTDLTASLGRFNLYAAIGNVEVSSEKYFKYNDKDKTKIYCIDPTAILTHVYIYLKDSYSFNDKKDSNSQYLGHWNKKDMLIFYPAQISSLVKIGNIKIGDSEITMDTINDEYLLNKKEANKPLNKRTGTFRTFIKKDIYYPIFNENYRAWREKHNRGGDFIIYSKPQLFKLKRPIKIKLETICRPAEPM
ncbi:DUF6402 family protein [Herbaspirillum sp. RTI4]|uniref:DUF6402 family protein n=1 Tax=Herbaspirillum sp. RTI4 TaxID=3048640 RepID=UPI002AB4B960|nr:DUF6402 family protein [Herbaspirillum sp. RTI4]MDY7579249.1 DUF6402 family protein [Herbaspirillum sp. RTI4]